MAAFTGEVATVEQARLEQEGAGGEVAPEFTVTPELLQLILEAASGGGEKKKGRAAPVSATVVGGQRAYFEIWGEEAPPGYIEGLVNNGLNVPEIILRELSKPALRETLYYRDQFADWASFLANLMGKR